MVASTTHVVGGGGGGEFGWILTMWSRNGSWYYSRGGGRGGGEFGWILTMWSRNGSWYYSRGGGGGGGGKFGWILTMWSRNGSWYYSRGGGTLRAGSGGQADGEFGPGVHSVHVLAEWCGRHKLWHRHVGHHPHHELNMWTGQVKVLWPSCWPPPTPWTEHVDSTSENIVTVMLATTHTMIWTCRQYKSKY